CREDPSTFRTELRLKDLVLMRKGGDQLARGCIQEFGAVIHTDCQDSSAVRTKVKDRPVRLQKPLPDRAMGKRCDKLARGHIPQAGHFSTRRQDPGAVRSKRPVRDALLMGKGGEKFT